MKKPPYPYRIAIIFLMLTVMPIGATQLGWYLYDQQTGYDFGMIVGVSTVIYALSYRLFFDRVYHEETTVPL
jgi:hypothetical protein